MSLLDFNIPRQREGFRIPELNINVQSQDGAWRKIEGNIIPYPESVFPTYGTLPLKSRKKFAEITFQFPTGTSSPYILSYFRSPLARDRALQMLKVAKEYDEVKMSFEEFFKSIHSDKQTLGLKTMKEMDFGDALGKLITKKCNSIQGLNNSKFMEVPLTEDHFNAMKKGNYLVKSGINKTDMAIQLANALGRPKFNGSGQIPTELFFTYFLSRLKALK